MRTPIERRIPESQAQISRPNPATTKIALHFVPQASPKQTPAAMRHGRSKNPRTGPNVPTSAGVVSYLCASFARAQSRSATRQWTAQSSQNARKTSSSAIRDITKCRPSRASSVPATQPSMVEPVSRRTSRHITQHHQRADRPRRRTANPAASYRTSTRRPAIIHLPASGWTTLLGPSAKMPSVEPELMILSASLPFSSLSSLTKFEA